MRDDQKMAAFIQQTLDDTLAGLDDLLPPDALACLRERLEDELTTHPVMSRLAREHAPIEVPAVRTDEGVDPEIEAEAKKHG